MRIKGELNYYQKKSGREINFILNKKEAFEVKLNPSPRDLSNLKRLCSELGIEKFNLVSKKFTSLENTIYGFAL